jgi:hypothetical protein
MNSQSSNQGLSGVFIGLGVLLIVMGALFFFGQAVGFELGRFGWPFFVIIPGLALSGVGLAAGGSTGERVTPLGAAVTMVGVILLYQNTVDHFESWAYAWALIGAALFVAGAFFFELVVGISGFGLGLDGFGWPLGLVIVGIVLLVGGFLYGRR